VPVVLLVPMVLLVMLPPVVVLLVPMVLTVLLLRAAQTVLAATSVRSSARS